MPIKIENAIPIPPHGNARYPFGELDVGQSFFTPNRPNSSVTSAARRLGRKFITRAVTENGVEGVRTWRTK